MPTVLNRRFTFLINRRFQFSVIAWIWFLAIMISCVYFFAVYEFFRSLGAQAQNAGLPPTHAFFVYLESLENKLNIFLILSTLLIFIISWFAGLILSHRVAGPIHKMTEHLNKYTPQNSPTLHFRESDYFQELTTAFNKFIGKEDKSNRWIWLIPFCNQL